MYFGKEMYTRNKNMFLKKRCNFALTSNKRGKIR